MNIAPTQSEPQIRFRDNAALETFHGKGRGAPTTHGVEAEVIADPVEICNMVDVLHTAGATAECDGFIFRTFNVNRVSAVNLCARIFAAVHPAAMACFVGNKNLVMESLARYLLPVLVVGILEVVGGKCAMFVGPSDKEGCAVLLPRAMFG